MPAVPRQWVVAVQLEDIAELRRAVCLMTLTLSDGAKSSAVFQFW